MRIRKKYEEELEDLVKQVVGLGHVVKDRFEESIEALTNHDKETADYIGKADDDIDDQYMEIEKICSDLLALQQPVASDLRLITASFKIVTDLERIGDLVVNITDYTLEIDKPPLLDEESILELASFAETMLIDSLEAYQEEDLEAARELAGRDEEMDQMCEAATRHLLQHLMEWEGQSFKEEAESLGQHVMIELLAIRDLERVADHAVNIAARTVYMISTKRDLL